MSAELPPQVIRIYVIKDRRLDGVGEVKRWLSIEEMQNMFKESIEHDGAGVEVSLTMPDGSLKKVTYNEGEVQDKESITVKHYLQETPGNNN